MDAIEYYYYRFHIEKNGSVMFYDLKYSTQQIFGYFVNTFYSLSFNEFLINLTFLAFLLLISFWHLQYSFHLILNITIISFQRKYFNHISTKVTYLIRYFYPFCASCIRTAQYQSVYYFLFYLFLILFDSISNLLI